MNLSWSDSYMQIWDKCHFWAYLRYVKKYPDLQPKPAADRGASIHDQLKDAVDSGNAVKLPDEAADFKAEFGVLLKYARKKLVDTELKVSIDRDWKRVSWKEAWGRFVYDVRVRFSPKELLLVDYKTGKKSGNEIKHTEQGHKYMLAEVMLDPQIELVHVEFWYLDQNDMMTTTYPRQHGLKFFKHINDRAVKATDPNQTWKPSPSKWACKFCPYRPDRGGQCPHGVVS